MEQKSAVLLQSWEAGVASHRSQEQETERRKVARLDLHWPVTLWRTGDPHVVESLTDNLSCEGFYCNSPEPFLPGEVLECALHQPVSGHAPEWVLHGQVVVVRVEARGTAPGYGVACQLRQYRVVRPERAASERA